MSMRGAWCESSGRLPSKQLVPFSPRAFQFKSPIRTNSLFGSSWGGGWGVMIRSDSARARAPMECIRTSVTLRLMPPLYTC